MNGWMDIARSKADKRHLNLPLVAKNPKMKNKNWQRNDEKGTVLESVKSA